MSTQKPNGLTNIAGIAGDTSGMILGAIAMAGRVALSAVVGNTSGREIKLHEAGLGAEALLTEASSRATVKNHTGTSEHSLPPLKADFVDTVSDLGILAYWRNQVHTRLTILG